MYSNVGGKERGSAMKHLMGEFLTYFPGDDNVHMFFAPGRVNLIGEHTDYNGGYVFPAALSMGTFMVVRLRQDNMYHLRSKNFDLIVSFSGDELIYKAEDDWGNYPKGILKELYIEAKKQGVSIKGADVLYYGNLPNGAGLSSSASIGMVTAYAFATLNHLSLTTKELAFICQCMENHFIGVNSGIMDQFAIGLGEKDHALYINCCTTDVQKIPLKLGNYKIVITNTNKRRGLADSKYNKRRSECENGLSILKKHFLSIRSLSDLTIVDLPKAKELIKDDTVYCRVRHVVTENDRVLKAIDALKKGDLLTFGEHMRQSHISLRDDYEVTGKELDALYNIQKDVEGCIGTRMTGAGFGGCTVSIVHGEKISAFEQTVARLYKEETGLTPSFYISEIGDGVKEIEMLHKEEVQ
jgi:galactokinase